MYDYFTQGNIIRSRANWYEKGEKNNKYFLSLEKNNTMKTCIRRLVNKHGEEITNSKAIMAELKGFYQDLYDNKDKDTCVDDIRSYIGNLGIPQLSEKLQRQCEGSLTYAECLNVLDTLKNNKSPGNDGLTAEFYKKFWPLLGTLLVDSLNTAFVHGKLSNSQRQGIIRLIEKKDKDKRFVENWRPISLLNVDYKIGSKALATRLEKVLPEIIHENQCAYVKGRTIFDAVRSIGDIMEYTKLNNIPGLMTTFDFKKAFDSISWQFLTEALRSFNFGESFIRWVKVLYSDISSCVMNNGFASELFEIKRGVRQGDPLSPYLFIIALEIVNVAIRKNKEIEGITLGKNEIKLSIFADDLTTFVKNTKSFRLLVMLLENFGNISGLKINEEKTEAYWLGSLHAAPENIGISTVNKPMKILGIYFTYDWQKYQELNFESIIKSIKKSINLWNWRNLTLLGRIQIIKTYAMPKFMFRAAQIPLTKDIIKEINTVLFQFVWRGRKDKIKRLSLIGDYKDGGLRMPHVESLIKAQRIICLKKYLDGNKSTWKLFLDHYLRDYGGSFLLKCNYDVSDLPRCLPKFYRECLCEWSSYNADSSCVSSPSQVLNEIIWNNKSIRRDGRPLYRNKIKNKGILRLGDILTLRDYKLKSWDQMKKNGITNAEYFLLMGIYNAIPKDWINLLRTQSNSSNVASSNDNADPPDASLPSSSRGVYWDLVEKIKIAPTAESKYEEIFSAHDLRWEQFYLLPRKATLDSKTREFQYKLLHRIIYTNKILYKMGLVPSPMCSFCGNMEESLEHLFIYCDISKHFWSSLTEWLNEFGFDVRYLSTFDIAFGLTSKDSLLLNHVIILGKYTIYQSRSLNIKPTLTLLKAKIHSTYQIESLIAKNNEDSKIHKQKWQKLLPFVDSP